MVDTGTFIELEQQKNNIWLNLDSFSPSQRVEKLKNLFGLLSSKLLKLVYGEVKKIEEVKYHAADRDFSFYDAKNAIEEATDIDSAREILEIGWTCYDILIARYGGQGVARNRQSPPKKLVARLFGPAIKDDDKLDALYEKVMKAFLAQRCPKTMLNFLAYCEFILPNFDLDMVNFRVARRRGGKSTEFLQEARRQEAYRIGHTKLEWKDRLHEADLSLIKKRFCEKQVFYEDMVAFEVAVEEITNSILCGDDFVLLGDKRLGMRDPNIKLTHAFQTSASNDNNLYLLVQNLGLADQRYIDAASTIMVNISRGEGLIFAPIMTLGIIPEYTGFEIFKKHPRLLSGDRKKVKTILKSLPSYTCTVKWPMLGDKKLWEKTGKSGNVLYDYYLNTKRASHVRKAQVEREKVPIEAKVF